VITWLRKCWLGFSIESCFSSTLFHTVLFGRKSLCATQRNCDFLPPHQGWSISINYLKFFCKRDLPLSSHLFIYPVICLYWYRLTPCALKTASCFEDKLRVCGLCLWTPTPARLRIVSHWPHLHHLFYISVVLLRGLFCTAHMILDHCGE